MSERIFEGFYSAYCPNYDERRRLGIRIIESTLIGVKGCAWTYFNCPEQNNCEHFTRPVGYPFIAEVLKRLR